MISRFSKNNNLNERLYTILIFFISMYFLGVLYSNDVTGDKIIRGSDEIERFETVTLGSIDIETKFSIRSIQDVYDKSGRIYYEVTFESKEPYYRVVCDIPSEYKSRLIKDSLYDVTLSISYMSEYVKKHTDLDMENSSLSDDIVMLEIKRNKNIAKLTGVDFFYSEYIVNGVFTQDEALESFKELYFDSGGG